VRIIVKSLFIALAVFAGFSRSAATAGTISLSWNPSPNANVVGYKIYYGTACQTYCTNLSVGNVTNITLSGLTEGTTYYFAATSVDDSGEESTYSGEVSFTVVPDAVPNLISKAVSTNGTFSFNVAGVPGAQYIVQASSDLVNWVTIQTNTSPFSFVDAEASAYPNRFYRACPAE